MDSLWVNLSFDSRYIESFYRIMHDAQLMILDYYSQYIIATNS